LRDSHHHFDHTSGLPAVVAEGITIVTAESYRLTSVAQIRRRSADDSNGYREL